MSSRHLSSRPMKNKIKANADMIPTDEAVGQSYLGVYYNEKRSYVKKKNQQKSRTQQFLKNQPISKLKRDPDLGNFSIENRKFDILVNNLAQFLGDLNKGINTSSTYIIRFTEVNLKKKHRKKIPKSDTEKDKEPRKLVKKTAKIIPNTKTKPSNSPSNEKKTVDLQPSFSLEPHQHQHQIATDKIDQEQLYKFKDNIPIDSEKDNKFPLPKEKNNNNNTKMLGIIEYLNAMNMNGYSHMPINFPANFDYKALYQINSMQRQDPLRSLYQSNQNSAFFPGFEKYIVTRINGQGYGRAALHVAIAKLINIQEKKGTEMIEEKMYKRQVQEMNRRKEAHDKAMIETGYKSYAQAIDNRERLIEKYHDQFKKNQL